MNASRVRSKDKRCVRTCEAIENAFFCFYAKNSHFKKLPVILLCKSAKISTPTFYRYYEGTHEVAAESHKKMAERLRERIENEMTLLVNLMKLFQFVADNKTYYEAILAQMCLSPFEDMRRTLEPIILKYIKRVRKVRRTREVDVWVCYEVSEYVISQLKWWVREEKIDAKKMDERIREILLYVRQRIVAADERPARKNNGLVGTV